MAFKLMALYHELAHLLFRRDPDMKDNFEDMVISNVKEYIARFGDLLFSSVSDSDYIPERVTGDYLKYISNQFVDRNEKYVNLIEEMAADTYAVSKTHATIFRNADRSNCIGASDAILSGISIFYSQISNYETVCSFWDTIIPQVILKSNNVPYGIDNILKHNEDSTLIRTFLFPPILFESVNLLDGNLWSKEDHLGIM